MVLHITYLLGLFKILNFGLAFVFLNSNTMSATARTFVAQEYSGINSIVILVWFVRQRIAFSTVNTDVVPDFAVRLARKYD
ncbi:hypothetical protein PRNP1_001638 [Phytophthora ramorum]